MADKTVIIDRDYIDSFSVKEYCENTLIPKYFPDIDVSLRTVGMLGYVTELITNYGEDTFNTGSVLFRETFPNRAQIQESIYSHAAIFQLDYILTKPATCKFLLVLEEEAITKNMINDYDKDTGIYHFYIDKNTTIYIEDIPYTLDYDIQMNIVKKSSVMGDDYIFTAHYIFDEYENSISEVKDPYVKVRRSKDGFMALEVQTHQIIREIVEETIIDNSVINYPALDITYTQRLAGFEVLYKAPTDTEYIQMKKQLVFSSPIKDPFCYYQFIREGQLRITFNSKDTFFQPKFDSRLKIILYYTRGEEGNFEVYNGTNISVVPNNEKYAYSNLFLTAAKPIGSSAEGLDQGGIENLQALTVEGYRTALALTTENDLQEYFNNYKYRYGNSDILFIKKRDDVYERVYSAFMIIRDSNYIFNTNTLNLKLNISDMTLVEKDTYVIEPGWLFEANDTDGFASFVRDPEKYDQYYKDYLQAIEDGTIPYIEDTSSVIPAYLDRPASYAEFKRRNKLEDRISVFDIDDTIVDKYDSPIDKKFLLMNPFMIRFIKQPNLVSTYMTYVKNISVLDFIDQNDMSFVQFITYTLKIDREFSKEKVYDISLNVATSLQLSDEFPIIQFDKNKGEYILNDRFSVVNNDLRIVLLIKNKGSNVCFIELYPQSFESNTFKFGAKMFTDDHLTSDGRVRILDGKIYRNDEDGSYYKVHIDDNTLYDKYDKDDNIIVEDVPVDTVTELYKEGKVVIWYNVHNMTAEDDIFIPLEEVTCELYTLYNRYYDETTQTLVRADDRHTNNPFYVFDHRYETWFWTNKYNTGDDPVTFIQPLDSVRTYLTFEDYTITEESEEGKLVFKHDIMDSLMRSLSFLRAKTIFDEERISYFMNTFFNNYKFITNIIDTRLRNCTNLDTKFYNTYGRSRDFVIGENGEKLDTVNLRLVFDMWFINGTDILKAVPEVKLFIKNTVEAVNETGTNNLYISNLMRKIETNFAYVDHIRFVQINRYNSIYQTVKSEVEDISELSVADRRFYVPELLVCDLDDIIINEYFVQ